MMRPLIFAANWKMHHGPEAGRRFIERLEELLPPTEGHELWFFPPAATLSAVTAALGGRPDARAGAQNVYWEPKGAFTGEMSVAIAKEAGARGALVGHSERRHVFGETDEDARRKVAAVLDGGLVPMLCVGEKLAEREAGRTEEVVLRQLDAALGGLPAGSLDRVLVAYEPVWAIGTGKNATPADAAAVHVVIRTRLAVLGRAADRPVLYGGSVNTKNVAALLAEPELDGVLVGGASLEPEGWAELISAGRRG